MRLALRALVQTASAVSVVPLLLIFRLVRRWVNVRLCIVGAHRFGHLALEPEVHLGLKSLGPDEDRSTLDLWSFGRPSIQANRVLASLWKKEISRCPGRLVGALVRGGKLVPALALEHVSLSIHGNRNVLDRCPSSISRHVPDGAAPTLERLGVDSSRPFVCLVIRDSAYYSSTGTAESSGYRLLNFKAQMFQQVSEYLDSQGYSVIRVGTRSDNCVDGVSSFVDYANSDLRTEMADLQLIKECSFVISTQTGPDALALALRKRVVYIDTLRISQFFLGSQLATWNPVKFIPEGSAVPLSLRQLLESEFVWMEDPDHFLNSGFEFQRASSVDIQDMVASFLVEFKGQVPREWTEMRLFANSLMTTKLGARGQSVWGNVTAQLNGYWLEKNHHWFLAD